MPFPILGIALTVAAGYAYYAYTKISAKPTPKKTPVQNTPGNTPNWTALLWRPVPPDQIPGSYAFPPPIALSSDAEKQNLQPGTAVRIALAGLQPGDASVGMNANVIQARAIVQATNPYGYLVQYQAVAYTQMSPGAVLPTPGTQYVVPAAMIGIVE